MDLEESKRYVYLWVCPWGNSQKYLIQEERLILNEGATMPWPGVIIWTQRDNEKINSSAPACMFVSWLRYEPNPVLPLHAFPLWWTSFIHLRLWVKTNSSPSSSPCQVLCNNNQKRNHYHFRSLSPPGGESMEGQSTSWWQQHMQLAPHFLVDGKWHAQPEEARNDISQGPTPNVGGSILSNRISGLSNS